MPFSGAQFLQLFEAYNQSIFPLQAIFVLAALGTVVLLIRPVKHSDKIISIFLAFIWFWMGFVYHLYFFTQINPAAYLFGGMFVLNALLLLYYGVLRDRLRFRLVLSPGGVIGILFILFALVIYPAVGYAFGRVYPAAPTFGTPCPTTIYTLGFLMLADKRTPLRLLIVPMLWSVIGASAAPTLGIKEDIGLLIAGMSSVLLTIYKYSWMGRLYEKESIG